MRPELNKIEQVEKYLNADLNIAELSAFENEMAHSVALQELVATQKLVQQAAMRKAIRADVLKYGAGASSSWWSNWGSWSSLGTWAFLNWLTVFGGIVLFFGLLIGGSYLLGYNSESEAHSEANYQSNIGLVTEIDTVLTSGLSTETYATNNSGNITHQVVSQNDSINEVSEESYLSKTKNTSITAIKEQFNYSEDTYCGGLKTWAKPEQQYFNIEPNKGATVEGENGTLIIVPSDAFVNEDGSLVTETVQLELVEALEMSEMVAYNLVTMADGKPLSSGGMIYVQPTVNGKKVNINPERPLYIEIPTNDYNPDMKSWEGEIDNKGDINWKNPKPLKKYLTKIDFENLDFLPKGFDQAVSNGMPFKSYTEATDELVDSLYYSISQDSVPGSLEQTNEIGKYKSDASILKRAGKIVNMYMSKFWSLFDSGDYLNGSGIVSGHIVDEEGISVASANIYISQNETVNKVEIKTDENGRFTYNRMKSGLISVTGVKNDATGWSSGNLDFSSINKYDTIYLPIDIVLVRRGQVAEGFYQGSVQGDWSLSNREPAACYINPQSIKTIRAEEFANTFLATKEFKQRLAILHQMPDAQKLFDIYVNNLDADLWVSDEEVANNLSGSDKAYFTEFAKEKLTNVENDGIYQKQLSAYYNKKKKANITKTIALQKAYAKESTAELLKEQAKLNSIIKEYNSLSAENNKNYSALASLSSETSNIDDVGKSKRAKPIKPRKVRKPIFTKSLVNSQSSYATTWYQTGWMNIDSYLHALGSDPKTVSINGGLDVEDKKGKVRTKIYQCLNTLKVVIPLVVIDKVAKAKFPNKKSAESKSMRNTYCIGLRKQGGTLEMAYRNYSPYQSDNVQLTWEVIEQDKLIERLKALPGFNSGLISAVKSEQKAIKEALAREQKRKEVAAKRVELQKDIDIQKVEVDRLQKILDAENAFIMTLKDVVDKCGFNEVMIVASTVPQYVGGEAAMYMFLTKNIVYPAEAEANGISGKVYVMFTVTESGAIIDVKVAKGAHPLLDAEAMRVVQSMPDWISAQEMGLKVAKSFTLPISFNVN